MSPIQTIQVEEPNRRRHRYVQHIIGPPQAVFPLLCPVREVEWVPGWMPRLVVSESGVAEKDCIFVTPGEPRESTWIVTRHDPDGLRVEMYKVTPEHTVTKLEIALEADDDGGTLADIAYEFTAISDSGRRELAELGPEWYEGFMKDWEAAMNCYLA